MCNGQLLPINQNQALFALMGTTYGGDGRVNFALPNLQGQVPIHMGAGFSLGERGGEASHTLIQAELPQHTHLMTVQNKSADAVAATASQSLFANGSVGMYGEGSPTTLNSASIGSVGGTQPHTNLQPYLTLSYCIALTGIFPSQT